ncbi:MAG TPA: hypothetical protein VGT08_11895 [Terracidiphilus sp.]|nr:hypothetical protein [Terracidiphilus sp.]
MARKATAERFKLAYPIVDAAQRKYQAKLDSMISDGTAEKIYEQAASPFWSIDGAASKFGISVQAGSYLVFSFKYRTRVLRTVAPVSEKDDAAQVSAPAAKAGESEQAAEIRKGALVAHLVVEHVTNRKDWHLSRSGEFTVGELRMTKGSLVGTVAEIHRQCVEMLEDQNIDPLYRGTFQELIDLANDTLDNRRERWKRGRDRAVHEKAVNAEFERQKMLLEIT